MSAGRRERGQALVEAVVAVPVCVVCALVIVDCGVIVRDRLAVAQAASRAADAYLGGRDELEAARGALPAGMRRSAEVDVDVEAGRVVVRARSSARIARLAGAPVVHRSSVEVDA